jgi:hypothetical protein
MLTPEQKKKLLKAKIAVALQDELGRVPKKEEIEQVFLLAWVMYKAILGLHFKPQEQGTEENRADGNLLTHICSLVMPGSQPMTKPSISSKTPYKRRGVPASSLILPAAQRLSARAWKKPCTMSGLVIPSLSGA